MKKCLWVLINKTFKKNLELLYGIGSYVEISNVILCTQSKNYMISCKLYVSDIQLFEESGTEGLNFIFDEAWVYTGIHDKTIVLSTSFDII